MGFGIRAETSVLSPEGQQHAQFIRFVFRHCDSPLAGTTEVVIQVVPLNSSSSWVEVSVALAIAASDSDASLWGLPSHGL
jgi:hypothetical protein